MCVCVCGGGGDGGGGGDIEMCTINRLNLYIIIWTHYNIRQ